MRIIVLNQFFYPDHSATSQLMTDLAESLVERGVDVTALASRGGYNGGETLSGKDTHQGVRIERAWATSFGKTTLAGRLCDYLSFYFGAAWKLLWLPRHDIIMVLTTPPLIVLVALIMGRLRNMRVVWAIQDVYPDVAVAVGALDSDSYVTRLVDRLSRSALRGADRIVVLSECMRERIAEKLGQAASSKIDVIHNWADGKQIEPLSNGGNRFIAEHDLEGLFVVLFSGNLGHVNDFSTVLEAAKLLRSRPDVMFVFAGDGAKTGEIRASVERNGLNNVKIVPYQPRKLVRFSLGAGDALLVTLAEGLAGLSVPSKSYGIMAAGRPLLFVGDLRSEVARLVTENNCGAVVASGESQRLSEIITEWAADRTKLAHLGSAARSLFLKRFDRQNAVSAYLDTFGKCLADAPKHLTGAPLREHN